MVALWFYPQILGRRQLLGWLLCRQMVTIIRLIQIIIWHYEQVTLQVIFIITLHVLRLCRPGCLPPPRRNPRRELLLFWVFFPLVLCSERQFLKQSVLFSLNNNDNHVLALVDSLHIAGVPCKILRVGFIRKRSLFLPLGAAGELTLRLHRTVNLSHSWNGWRNELYYVKTQAAAASLLLIIIKLSWSCS